MMTIDVRQVGKEKQVMEITNGSVYIVMGKHTYYLDNSTNEEIISRWETGSTEDVSFEPKKWINTMALTPKDSLKEVRRLKNQVDKLQELIDKNIKCMDFTSSDELTPTV